MDMMTSKVKEMKED